MSAETVEEVHSHATSCRRSYARVFTEGLLVVATGVIFAWAANALSPRGLSLTRNYFPSGHPSVGNSLPTPTNNQAILTNGPSDLSPEADAALARLISKGLQPVGRAQVSAWFHDPAYAVGRIVFVDARNDQHYQAGHIPGAHQLDHYRAPAFLPAVLPVCLMAERVVVYCGGGECEDSEFTAITLRDLGVPAERIFVYAGGIKDWQEAHYPVEQGSRNSGVLKETPP